MASRGQQSISAVFIWAPVPGGWRGSAHSLVIKVLVMSHEEGVGGGWDREIKRKKRRGVGGLGRAVTLPPGVLSRCQEDDRFLLSGHESACSVLSCQGPCLSIYLQHTSIQNMHEHSPFRVAVSSTKSVQMLYFPNPFQLADLIYGGKRSKNDKTNKEESLALLYCICDDMSFTLLFLIPA